MHKGRLAGSPPKDDLVVKTLEGIEEYGIVKGRKREEGRRKNEMS